MTNHIIPWTRVPSWIIGGILIGGLPSVAELWLRHPNPHIVYASSLFAWGLFALGWWQAGTYAKSIVVEGDDVHVLLQNGHKLQFYKRDIVAVKVGRLGNVVKNVVITTRNTQRIRFTSNISEFVDLLEELGCAGPQEEGQLQERTIAKTRQEAYLWFAAAIIFIIVVVINVAGHESPPSMSFYWGLAGSVSVLLFSAWILWRIKKPHQ